MCAATNMYQKMYAFFKELFEYNHVSNQKLIERLAENRSALSERAVQLISHMCNAQQIWNARILKEAAFQVWQLNEWEVLPSIDLDNYNKSVKILEQVDLRQVIMYSTSSGARFSNKVSDILFHVINHSTYHRGQLAMDMRRSGLEPLSTDYIFYKR